MQKYTLTAFISALVGQPAKKKKGAKEVKTDVWNTYISPNLPSTDLCAIRKGSSALTIADTSNKGGGMEISNFRPICMQQIWKTLLINRFMPDDYNIGNSF